MTTMEECIEMLVADIEIMLKDATDEQIIPDYKESIKIRLNSIRATLEEGDPK